MCTTALVSRRDAPASAASGLTGGRIGGEIMAEVGRRLFAHRQTGSPGIAALKGAGLAPGAAENFPQAASLAPASAPSPASRFAWRSGRPFSDNARLRAGSAERSKYFLPRSRSVHSDSGNRAENRPEHEVGVPCRVQAAPQRSIPSCWAGWIIEISGPPPGCRPYFWP